jgi:thioredoxin 1
MQSLIELNFENFDEAIASDRVIVVEFFSEKAQLCLQMKESYQKLATDYFGKLKVSRFSINNDQDKQLAKRFGVISVPNVKFFRNGLEIDSILGFVPIQTLKILMDKYSND